MGSGNNPSQQQAGGPMGGSMGLGLGGSPAGGPMSTSPTTLPYTSAISIPGAPFWGPGSTFVQPNPGQTGQQMPEIIGPQGNAWSLVNGSWTPSGTHATVPGAAPPPPPNAPVNSLPGSPLQPWLSAGALDPLQKQIQDQLAALKGNKALGASTISGDVSNFFANLPQTVANNPAGGYMPGYQIPQSSIQYVPGSAVAGLEQQLERDPLRRKSDLSTLFSDWRNSLGNLGPSGTTVPTLGGISSLNATGDPRPGATSGGGSAKK